jgi:hypothetical protein
MAPVQTLVSSDQAFQLLQKFGIQTRLDQKVDGIHNEISTIGGSASHGAYTDEQLRTALSASRDDGGGPFSFDTYNSPGFGRPSSNLGLTAHRQNRSQTLSSFSPFSPDPNLYLVDGSKPAPVATFSRSDLPHPSRSYAPGFGPLSQEHKAGSNGKISPTSTRPPSRSRYGPYLDSSLPAFQSKQTSGDSEGSLSRPSSGSATRGASTRGFEGTEQDPIHDLNGTLASLDLDQTLSPWKTPVEKSDHNNWGLPRLKTVRSPHTTSPPP